MILACHNIEKSFGDRVIVHEGSFHIEEREKAALVGINGAGKSTILKMIMNEEPLDGGDIILAKGKTIGYLAQHQNMIPDGTIYEEVRSAKADIIEMEHRIRSIELELKSLSGEELESRLDTYNRLQSEFEARNGYACESEIVGVLKGLGFAEYPFRRSEDARSAGKTAAHQSGYPAPGRAYQPSGSEFHCMAGNLSDQLSRSCFYRIPRPLFPEPCSNQSRRD